MFEELSEEHREAARRHLRKPISDVGKKGKRVFNLDAAKVLYGPRISDNSQTLMGHFAGYSVRR